MGLKVGDMLAIRRSATVWLSQYDSLKPEVRVSRVLGYDPEADRDEMERIAYVELRRAIVEEVLSRRRFDELLGDDKKLTPLLKHCAKVIRRGYDKASPRSKGFGIDTGSDESGSEKVGGEERERLLKSQRRLKRTRGR